jgi:uncharacterized membrane protein YphA (DoxX/SURF4 family)
MAALLPTLDPSIALAIRFAMALLFAAAAFHKLSDLQRFRLTLAAYRVMPDGVVVRVSTVVIGFEMALAIGFLIPGLHATVALGAASLLIAYTAAIAINIARGRRDIDCGCGGPDSSQPISTGLITRNALLIVAVSMTATVPSARTLTWLDGFAVTATVLCAVFLWTAANALLALSDERARAAIESGAHS